MLSAEKARDTTLDDKKSSQHDMRCSDGAHVLFKSVYDIDIGALGPN